ncbi:CRISPR-associated endonuclease Cas1 [Planctomycetales bacterium]|nr:CRISPR-associated endonuclease Cas1 [Planctomycetales bacterium]
MNHRILDFSSAPYRLHTRHRQLVIESSIQGTSSIVKKQTVPLEDIAVLLVAHKQVSFTQSVMELLAENGGILVVCNSKSLPVGIYAPLVNHSLPCKKIKLQINAPEPVNKRAWQQIVKAKIQNQGLLLQKLHGKDFGLSALSKIVKSGDPHNVEARAAKRYWQKLFRHPEDITDAGAGNETPFHRKSDGDDFTNLCLNYGYGVLRAVIARAVCATGFHPAIGIHHHNQYNGYCLADDLMEPFRPVVDEVVHNFINNSSVCQENCLNELTPKVKREILEPLLGRFKVNGELETLFDASTQLAESLVNFFDKRCKKLRLPDSCEVYEEPKPF